MIALAQEMARSPEGILQRLAETALTLCRAHSAGLSLLEAGDQKRSFHWRAIAGQWAPHLGGGTPRDFGPCGTVLDRDASQVFSHPELDFPYFAEVTPYVEEGLLIPFYVGGEAVGTIWVISHDESHRFDAEDLRVMTNLGNFAAAAYKMWLSLQAQAKANEELRDSEGRLAAILEQLPVGVGLFDCDGRLRQSNTVLQRFVAADLIPSKDPHAGRRWRAFQADGSLLPTSEYPGARALRGETVVPGIDLLHTSEVGHETWVRFTATPFRDKVGKVTGAVTVMQDIDQQKRADQLNLLLIAELQHRTRNLLAVVKAISGETLAASRSLEDFGSAFNSRLANLARVQDLLVRGEADAVTLGELVRLELRAVGAEPDGRRVSVEGPDVRLPHEALQILAFAVHELATNARKHGALGTPDGRLAVSWQVSALDGARRLALVWHESGIAPRGKKAGPMRKGFGRTLIEDSLRYQLDAQTRLEFGQNEVRCSVTMTLESRGAEVAHGGSRSDRVPHPARRG